MPLSFPRVFVSLFLSLSHGMAWITRHKVLTFIISVVYAVTYPDNNNTTILFKNKILCHCYAPPLTQLCCITVTFVFTKQDTQKF